MELTNDAGQTDELGTGRYVYHQVHHIQDLAGSRRQSRAEKETKEKAQGDDGEQSCSRLRSSGNGFTGHEEQLISRSPNARQSRK